MRCFIDTAYTIHPGVLPGEDEDIFNKHTYAYEPVSKYVLTGEEFPAVNSCKVGSQESTQCVVVVHCD